MEQHGYSKLVWLAEDDTKIDSGLFYDRRSDIIVGFVLPLDEATGVPITKVFKFKSVNHLRRYLAEEHLSSYVKLITIRSLTPGSVPFILAVYGTNGSDNTETVLKRWSYVRSGLASLGVTLIGKFSVFYQELQLK